MSEWTYYHTFRVPRKKNPSSIQASVFVAYKPLEGVGADTLDEYYGWTRMVVWIPDSCKITAHVNISSNELDEVMKARLEGFDNGKSVYLIDYAKAERDSADVEEAYGTRDDDKPWEESKIAPPAILINEDNVLHSKGKVPARTRA